MNIVKVLTIAIICIIPSTIYAEEMCIAVIDFKADGVSKKTARQVTELIRNHMVDTGRFKVVERSRINIILREQGLQQSGTTDDDSAIQVGKLLSASRILIGSVISIGKSIIITGRVVNVKLGVAEFSQDQKVKRKKDLYEGTRLFVKKLNDKISGNNKTSVFIKSNDSTDPENENADWDTRAEKEDSADIQGIKYPVKFSVSAAFSTLDIYSMGGVSLNSGIRIINNFYFGAEFSLLYEFSTFLDTGMDTAVTNELDKRFEEATSDSSFFQDYNIDRTLMGGGLVFYYEGLNWYDIIILAPGFVAGYYEMDYTWHTSHNSNKLDLYNGKQTYYGGPKLKLGTGFGFKNIFMEFEYTLLIGAASEMGIDQFYHLYNYGLRIIF